jgi:ABC-type branched-subunit amino acid transport system ATPase component
LRHRPRVILRQQAAAHDDAQQPPAHARLLFGDGSRIDPGGFPEHDPARRSGLEHAVDDHAVEVQVGLSAVPHRTAALRRQRLEEVFRHFPRLEERIEQPAKTMSGGEQQMLAIARVMMAGARLILMDEPTQGLAPALIRHIRDMIRELVRLGITVLLVEQNARVALSVCDRGYIMEKGVIVFEGPSAELRSSPVTREKLGV